MIILVSSAAVAQPVCNVKRPRRRLLLFPQARVAELLRFYLRKVAASKQLLLPSAALTRARNHLEVMLRKTAGLEGVSAAQWNCQSLALDLMLGKEPTIHTGQNFVAT